MFERKSHAVITTTATENGGSSEEDAACSGERISGLVRHAVSTIKDWELLRVAIAN
jgi:hypothetical protein